MSQNIPSTVPPDTIERINKEYAQAGSALPHAIACGEALNDAQAIVEEGQWLKWLKANCPAVHQTTANDYMRLAKHKALIKGTALSIRQALSQLPKRPRAPSTKSTNKKEIKLSLAGSTPSVKVETLKVIWKECPEETQDEFIRWAAEDRRAA